MGGAVSAARRADIQGLRAIAVLAVLLFHAGGWLGSGYIGVDIFFVISGYVIAMAYLDRFLSAPDLRTALDFFRRRILRLAPALLVVIALTLVLTSALLPPTENKLLAIRAGLAATQQKANIFFANVGTNYWLDSLHRNPFLHTWSLGAEWQFYLVFPLPFLAAALSPRVGATLKSATGVAALAIVLAGSLLLFVTSDTAFYSPWSRYWQFALGMLAFLATRGRHPAQANSGRTSALLIGLLIVALLPRAHLAATAGSVLASLLTAALLYSAPAARSLPDRLLTGGVAQSVGNASYSIYLVHWPIIVFGHLLLGESLAFDALLVAASLGAGFLLSWAIEYRFQHAAHPWRAAFCCLAVAGVAFAAERRKGDIPAWPWYGNPPLVAQLDGFHNYWWSDIEGAKGQLLHAARFESGDLFRRGIPGTNVQEAVAARGTRRGWVIGIGNSYIQSAGAMLRRFARDEDVSLALYHISDCDEANAARCAADFDRVIASLEPRNAEIGLIYIAFRGIDEPNSLTGRLVGGLLSRVGHAGIRVVVQGPSPALAYDPLACLSRLRPCPATQMLPVDLARLAASERRLEELFARQPDLTIWSPYRHLCREGACLVRLNDASLFMDSDHLSNAGQQHLYAALRATLSNPEARLR